jgi:hypothetical protein
MIAALIARRVEQRESNTVGQLLGHSHRTT